MIFLNLERQPRLIHSVVHSILVRINPHRQREARDYAPLVLFHQPTLLDPLHPGLRPFHHHLQMGTCDNIRNERKDGTSCGVLPSDNFSCPGAFGRSDSPSKPKQAPREMLSDATPTLPGPGQSSTKPTTRT